MDIVKLIAAKYLSTRQQVKQAVLVEIRILMTMSFGQALRTMLARFPYLIMPSLAHHKV